MFAFLNMYCFRVGVTYSFGKGCMDFRHDGAHFWRPPGFRGRSFGLRVRIFDALSC